MSQRLDRVLDWGAVAKIANYNPIEMADICHISSRQLQRFFKQRYGKSPSKWLRELQCSHACELIRLGYSNKAVVAELSFASESHFCREFKKHFGQSPQSYAPTFTVNLSSLDNNGVGRQ